MSIERIYYCDGPDCETHQRTTRRPAPLSWLVMFEAGTGWLFFCSWDCVMKFAAEVEPTEVVEA